MSSLQQFNLSYVPGQDRLLLKISSKDNKEYRVWLTRRYTILLMKALNTRMEALGGVDALSVQKDNIKELGKDATKEAYIVSDSVEYPLGETGILAFQLKVTPSNEGKIVRMQLLPEKGGGLDFNLDGKLLLMMSNLLTQAIAHSQWNIKTQQEVPIELH